MIGFSSSSTLKVLERTASGVYLSHALADEETFKIPSILPKRRRLHVSSKSLFKFSFSSKARVFLLSEFLVFVSDCASVLVAMASQDSLEKMKVRQNYRNLWHTDLMSTIQADFPYCCLSLWCGPCVSYLLRKRALYNDMSRYVCCAGYVPCSGRCGESKCPEFCLCAEVFLCFGNSVASTRFLLQDEFNIQTTQCDNCIIGFMFCLGQLACIFSLVACIVGSDELREAAQILNCISDLVYWTVCACMQTQHKIEMDKRDGKFGPQPMAVPPMQQMSRLDQSIPPTAGYQPQGQPYGYPPPPQGQPYGYPPAGYPPPGYPR